MTELEQLQQELADSAARSDIETGCLWLEHSAPHAGRWYVLNESEWVVRAARYLELRGLLVCHPEVGGLVRVKAEEVPDV